MSSLLSKQSNSIQNLNPTSEEEDKLQENKGIGGSCGLSKTVFSFQAISQYVNAKSTRSPLFQEKFSKKCRKRSIKNYVFEKYFQFEELEAVKNSFEIEDLEDISPAGVAMALRRMDLIKEFHEAKLLEMDESKKMITPMTCAIIIKYWDGIRFLIEKKLNAMYGKDVFENTPLLTACLRTDWSCDEFLTLFKLLRHDHRTDVAARNKIGLTITHVLAMRGWGSALEEVLPKEPLGRKSKRTLYNLVNSSMIDGTSPLMLAISQGHCAVCRILLDKGADPCAHDSSGFTCVCRGARYYYDLDDFKYSFKPPEICQMVIESINEFETDWSLALYLEVDYCGTMRRFQMLQGYPEENEFFNASFDVYFRPCFTLLIRFIEGAAELFLQLRIFRKLVASGSKELKNKDFMVIIFGIMFDILVYAEDISNLWPDFVSHFIQEGGGDLCLKVLQNYRGFVDNILNVDKHLSQTSLKGVRSRDIPGTILLKDYRGTPKNVGAAAILPLIQLIDSPRAESWFCDNFEEVAAGCKFLQNSKDSEFVSECRLTDAHVIRTTKKYILFKDVFKKNTWISPFEKRVWNTNHTDSNEEFRRIKNCKKKKHKKKPIVSANLDEVAGVLEQTRDARGYPSESLVESSPRNLPN